MWQALAVTLVAGFLGGTVLLPIKLMWRWPFQNSWAVYSFWAYLVMPWVVAAATVPHLVSLYSEVSVTTALICGASGLGWGFAVVLFGVSVHLVGLSLASAIIYGASVAVGSLAPLLISEPQRLVTSQGVLILAGNAVMVLGITACAFGGKAREGAGSRQAGVEPGQFKKGLAASIAAALLSALFNIALVYGQEFNRLAVARGASPLNAANAQWAFTVTFGYLPNLAVSLIALSRMKLWPVFSKGPLSHWLWPPLMGLMWIGGTALYGSSATMMGSLGPVVGWPVYMSVMITVGNFWGWVTGEWRGAPPRATRLLVLGIAIQVVAITILSISNR